jgi:hypothetical protein
MLQKSLNYLHDHKACSGFNVFHKIGDLAPLNQPRFKQMPILNFGVKCKLSAP